MLNENWGFINYPHDANTILNHLSTYTNAKSFVLVEIGVATGKTGNRMVDHLKSIGVKKIKYYGVDNLDLKKNNDVFGGKIEMNFEHPEMQFIQGDFTALPKIKNVDFGFVDACHCAECVYKDGIAMSKIVKVGGCMAFHDTSLSWQYPHGDKDQKYWQHTNCKVSRPLNVVEGIIMGRAKWHGNWDLIQQDGDELSWGGIRIYQKLSATP